MQSSQPSGANTNLDTGPDPRRVGPNPVTKDTAWPKLRRDPIAIKQASHFTDWAMI